MKSVKELLTESVPSEPNPTHLSKMDRREPKAFPSDKSLPAVITLKRKGVRVFSDNQKIALYYSQALDKYVSIPFDGSGRALGVHLSEDSEINEWVPAALAVAGRVATAVAPYAGRAARGAYRLARKGLGKIGRGARVAAKRGGNMLAAGAGIDLEEPSGGAGSSERNNLERLSGKRETQFGHIQPKVQEPVTQVARANNIANERRNANQVWNNNAPVVRGGVQESNLAIIHDIIKTNERKSLCFEGTDSVVVTPRIAKKLVNVHESLNKKNKQNFEGMLNESITTLQKAINFAIKA
jgi:hypothetical protein